MLERSEIKYSSKANNPFIVVSKTTIHINPHTNLALRMPNSLQVPISDSKPQISAGFFVWFWSLKKKLKKCQVTRDSISRHFRLSWGKKFSKRLTSAFTHRKKSGFFCRASPFFNRRSISNRLLFLKSSFTRGVAAFFPLGYEMAGMWLSTVRYTH